jgi:hypothetical protein
MITPPRKPGRPPNPEPGSRVTTWIATSEHDRLVALAKARDQSISALVRTLIRRPAAR